MSDHLITDILEIEAEADSIVSNAKRKAGEIMAKVPGDVESIRTSCENEYREQIETLKQEIADLQKSEEGRLRSAFELTKKKFISINDKNTEDAVNWVVNLINEL